uniref:AIG1-type G domain-containing protein n=1 Tax=Lepisosteus oculatus TaxID=7918 RepID=W5MUM9_LEPOC
SVTQECQKTTAKLDGRQVTVVDTPGLFGKSFSHMEIKHEIIKCFSLSSPGSHAILLVTELGRFTEEEKKTMKLIQGVFGEEASVILLTCADKLKGRVPEEYIEQGENNLKNFVQKCGNGCQTFNNMEWEDRSQVTEFLEKTEQMVRENGGGHYTNVVYETVEAEEKGTPLKTEEWAEKYRKETEDIRERMSVETSNEKKEELEMLLQDCKEEFERRREEIWKRCREEAEQSITVG